MGDGKILSKAKKRRLPYVKSIQKGLNYHPAGVKQETALTLLVRRLGTP